MTIGELIKEYRKKADLTQKELAHQTGLAVGTIQQYEGGKRIPMSKNAKVISDVLGIDLKFMMNTILEQNNKDPEFYNLYGVEVTKLSKQERKEWEENFFPEVKDKSLRRLLDAYDTLNKHGKREMVLRAEEMTEVHKFTTYDGPYESIDPNYTDPDEQ
jgi:transcriptional regulator, merR family